MFCLRTWIPILFFLMNVSPVYLILFVSAFYYLNRPCLYCSLLLTVLVISLYDWRSDWFEPRNNIFSPIGIKSLQDTAQENASLVASVVNATTMSAAKSSLEGLGRRIWGEEQTTISGAQWLRDLVGRKEWRIPCIDVAVRL